MLRVFLISLCHLILFCRNLQRAVHEFYIDQARLVNKALKGDLIMATTTSSSSSSSSLSSKNMAVIELLSDESVHVIRARSLQNFTTQWIDSIELWPFPSVWFTDDDLDVQCKILKIDCK